MEESSYGFKTMLGQTLLRDINQFKRERENLNKSPKKMQKSKAGGLGDVDEADILICRQLQDEAKESWNKLNAILTEIKASRNFEDGKSEVADFDPADHIGTLELLSVNFRAENDVFVENFVQM